MMQQSRAGLFFLSIEVGRLLLSDLDELPTAGFFVGVGEH
jgi:hypothetical protein